MRSERVSGKSSNLIPWNLYHQSSINNTMEIPLINASDK